MVGYDEYFAWSERINAGLREQEITCIERTHGPKKAKEIICDWLIEREEDGAHPCTEKTLYYYLAWFKAVDPECDEDDAVERILMYHDEVLDDYLINRMAQ